jgi:hypothetical protein
MTYTLYKLDDPEAGDDVVMCASCILNTHSYHKTDLRGFAPGGSQCDQCGGRPCEYCGNKAVRNSLECEGCRQGKANNEQT